MSDQTEYFIVANSFAAPFCSDQSTGFQASLTPISALAAFAARYTHPFGLYAAEAYASAEAYHKGEKPVARWLSNHARAIAEKKPTLIVSHGPGSLELDGKAVKIESPKAGRAVLIALILSLLPALAQAQTISSWQLRIYNVGAATPISAPTDLLTANVQCNQNAPSSTNSVNPTRVVFDDPNVAGKVCIWVDPGTGPLSSMPFGASSYEGTLTATNAAGTTLESGRAPFSHPGQVPNVPAGLRLVR